MIRSQLESIWTDLEGRRTTAFLVIRNDKIVFERYANEFRDAGYEAVMNTRPMQGTRWFASATGYDNAQLDIEGYESRPGRPMRRDRDPHVVGYDPDVFVHMGFAQADANFANDERRFRSHLSLIVTSMVNKIVTIPVLKDHRSAGVTLMRSGGSAST